MISSAFFFLSLFFFYIFFFVEPLSISAPSYTDCASSSSLLSWGLNAWNLTALISKIPMINIIAQRILIRLHFNAGVKTKVLHLMEGPWLNHFHESSTAFRGGGYFTWRRAQPIDIYDWKPRTRSAPRKAVDLVHIFLW